MKKTSVLNVFCEIRKMFLIITMCYLGSRCWDIILRPCQPLPPIMALESVNEEVAIDGNLYYLVYIIREW